MTPAHRRIPPNAIKVDLPDTVQGTDYTCGASCLQAICGYYGVGPRDEEEYTRVMRIHSDVGAHPHNVLIGIAEYGLHHCEKWPMSLSELRAWLDRRIPVLLMLQAWATNRRLFAKTWGGYATEFRDGHWVAAIGYDAAGVYFEDPSLATARGFLTNRELRKRWHDVGPYWIPPYEKHMYQYGIAIWKPYTGRPPYFRRALYIG